MNVTSHTIIDDQLERIRQLDIDDLARRTHEAIELERRWPSTPDGHPPSTPGAEPHHTTPPPIPAGRCRAERGCPFQRPCPNHDTHVTLTPAEAAATARIAHRDDIAKDVRRATDAILQATAALHAADAALARIAKARNGVILPPPVPICAVLNQIGAREPVRSTVTVVIDGAKVKMPLGQWAYKFHRREGRLPTIDECRAHVGHRTIRTTTTKAS